VAFDFDGRLASEAETGSGGEDEDGAMGNSEERAGGFVKEDLVDATSYSGARKLLTGAGGQCKYGISNRHVEAVVTRAEGNAGRLGGVEIEACNRFEGRTQDEDTAAILQS
jgi:hypothetical protein